MHRTFPTLLAAAIGLMACSTADLGSEGEASSEVVEPGTAGDETAQAADGGPDPESEPDPEPLPDREDIAVVGHGFSTYEVSYDESLRASWAVVVSNPNPDTHVAESINVTVTLLDDSGSVLSSASDSIAVLLPGQTAAVSDSTFEDVGEVAEMRVQARTRTWSEEDGPFGEFTTSDVNVREDTYEGWTITGQVASTFTTDFEDVYAVAVLKNDEGDIVGGGFTFVEFVPADGDTSFQISIMDGVQNVASADVHVALSNLSLW